MKKSYILIVCILFAFSFSIYYNVFAQTWSAPVQVIEPSSGSGGFSGNFSNLIVLANGNPAMADNPGGGYGGGYLRYLRANNPAGTGAWTVIIVDPAPGTGKYLSLQIVNGNPAISYYDEINNDLKFVRATDPSGTAWGAPKTIDEIGDVGHTPLYKPLTSELKFLIMTLQTVT